MKITLKAKSQVREASITGFPNSANFKKRICKEDDNHGGFPVFWTMDGERVEVITWRDPNGYHAQVREKDPSGARGQLIY